MDKIFILKCLEKQDYVVDESIGSGVRASGSAACLCRSLAMGPWGISHFHKMGVIVVPASRGLL